MTDDDVSVTPDAEIPEDDEQDPEDQPDEASPGYIFVMDDGRPHLNFPEVSQYIRDHRADHEGQRAWENDAVFIEAQHPMEQSDRVSRAGVEVELQDVPVQPGRTGKKRHKDQRAQQQRAGGGSKAFVHISPVQAFLAKCLSQITDFRLLYREKDAQREGEFRDVICRYDADNDGDNEANRRIYRWFLRSDYLDQITGFLDLVAGLDTQSTKDLLAAKKEQPQLLTDL